MDFEILNVLYHFFWVSGLFTSKSLCLLEKIWIMKMAGKLILGGCDYIYMNHLVACSIRQMLIPDLKSIAPPKSSFQLLITNN